MVRARKESGGKSIWQTITMCCFFFFSFVTSNFSRFLFVLQFIFTISLVCIAVQRMEWYHVQSINGWKFKTLKTLLRLMAPTHISFRLVGNKRKVLCTHCRSIASCICICVWNNMSVGRSKTSHNKHLTIRFPIESTQRMLMHGFVSSLSAMICGNHARVAVQMVTMHSLRSA